MTIDRELLWQAWPTGVLLQNGLTTVGGWLIDHRCKEGPILLHRRRGCTYGWPPVAEAKTALDAGDLLPRVAVNDVAAWACCLVDLAEACDWPAGAGAGDLTWRLVVPHTWMLTQHTRDMRDTLSVFTKAIMGDTAGLSALYEVDKAKQFIVNAEDPALALVLARIQLREAAAKREKT